MLRINFYLNREFVTADVPAELSTLEFLREQRGLTGAKEVCNEGDCGACTVALGRYANGRVVYRAVNSCLLPAAKLHGRHVVTAEGLAEGERLHPVQQALVDQHAVQCGYCTPGMVMALFCLFVENSRPSSAEMLAAMEGTLCRCTGYAAIQAAARAIAQCHANDPLAAKEIRPGYFANIEQELSALVSLPVPIENGNVTRYLMPQNLDVLFDELERIREPEDYCLVGGGTDTVVEARFKGRQAGYWLDLSRIGELNTLELTATHLHIGANVTLAELVESPLVAAHFPALAQSLTQMSSAQIRNVATLAGNICTASPIADAVPPLLVYGAEVVLQTRFETHRLPLSGFLIGYRKTALCPREIVTAIEIPLHHGWSRFEKTGKRRALDIASVNSALALTLEGDRLTDVRLAFGGVAPMTILARQTAAYLSGKTLTDAVINEAAELAVREIQPINDVRGSAEFRRLLTRNHVIKHLTCLLET